jgi:hypothetical protein
MFGTYIAWYKKFAAGSKNEQTRTARRRPPWSAVACHRFLDRSACDAIGWNPKSLPAGTLEYSGAPKRQQAAALQSGRPQNPRLVENYAALS